jgi:hypothetical protein
LKYVSTSLQLTISPTIVSFGLRTDMTLHLPPLESGHPASDVGLTGLITVSDEAIQASLTATNWTDAFGINGLNVSSLTVQLGIDFAGLPSIGLAATVSGLPTSLANVIGYQQGTPITIALNVSADEPLLDFSIGTKDSGTAALRPLAAFGAPDMITVSYAKLYISPVGATIGSTYYPPGIELALQATLVGVPLDIEVKVDPTAPSLYFKGSVGQITAGSLSFGPTTLIIDAGPGRFDIEFDGQVHLGPGTVDIGPALRFTGSLDAAVRLRIGTSGISAHLDFDASVKGSNYLPQSVCFYGGVLPYPCNYHWVDDAPLNVQATNVGFDINSSGLTIDIPNTTSSITFPWSSNHSSASAGERSLTGPTQAAPAVLKTAGEAGSKPATVLNPNAAAAVSALAPFGSAPTGSASGSSAAAKAPVQGNWQRVSSLPSAAYFAASAALPHGAVLVAGGLDGGRASAAAASYDPTKGTWTVLPSMHQARVGASAVALPGGRVLVAGGSDGHAPLASAEMYDPNTHRWTATRPMGVGRQLAVVTTLSDGRVLVAGGRGASGALASAELFTPSSGTWAATGSMASARMLAAGARLTDGRVLVAGGVATHPLASAELFDPTTGSWTATAPLPHEIFGGSLTTLADGTVLASGDSAFAERFDPGTERWTRAGTQNAPRLFASTVRLTDGRVLVAGGISGNATSGSTAQTMRAADVYDPAVNGWRATSSLTTATAGAVAALLPDGGVLVAGGGVGHDARSPRSDVQVWQAPGAAAAPLGGTVHLPRTPFTGPGGSSPTGWWIAGGSVGGALALLALLVLFVRRRDNSPGSPDEV